jgi:hypothetical protein
MSARSFEEEKVMGFGWHDVQIILLCLWTIGLWELANWFIDRRKKTLKWKCKVCGFTVKTDSPSTFMVSTTSHNHASLNEQRMLDPWQTPETKEACKRFHPGEICVPGRNHPAANG